MAYRATITLDKEAYEFLVAMGGDNRSAYINQLIREQQRRMLALAIQQANREEGEDPDYHDQLLAWDEALADGLG